MSAKENSKTKYHNPERQNYIPISFHVYEPFTFVIWLQVKDDTFIDISFIVTIIFMKERCLCERDYAGLNRQPVYPNIIYISRSLLKVGWFIVLSATFNNSSVIS
jgi:hypothetical protein